MLCVYCGARRKWKSQKIALGTCRAGAVGLVALIPRNVREVKACKKSSSASDDQAETIDPGPTAAVDACDAVATGWDERMPEVEKR
jgi:hypothetical protein